MKRIFLILFLFIVSTGLLCAGNAQRAATSKYFHSLGGGFGGDGEKHELVYGVTLEVLTPIPDGAVADFLFDNPGNKKVPLLTTVVIKGSPKTIDAKSPALPSIENNKVYTYKVILYRDETRKEKLGEHSQKLGFSVPEQIFKTIFKAQYFKKD